MYASEKSFVHWLLMKIYHKSVSMSLVVTGTRVRVIGPRSSLSGFHLHKTLEPKKAVNHSACNNPWSASKSPLAAASASCLPLTREKGWTSSEHPDYHVSEGSSASRRIASWLIKQSEYGHWAEKLYRGNLHISTVSTKHVVSLRGSAWPFVPHVALLGFAATCPLHPCRASSLIKLSNHGMKVMIN